MKVFALTVFMDFYKGEEMLLSFLVGNLKHWAVLCVQGHPIDESQSWQYRLGFLRPHIGY